MRFFSQSFLYDDPWSIVSLAFFLRYPNPYARHVVSCDVISRTPTSDGTLLTTRLILKRGALPKWAPRGIVSRAESWVIEESEVDVYGREVRCRTKNLDHVKIMQVEETTELREVGGQTLQTTQARFISGFGWGLTKRIENHGLSKFKANIQKSREGVALVLRLLREAQLQPLAIGADGPAVEASGRTESWPTVSNNDQNTHPEDKAPTSSPAAARPWSQMKTWLGWG